MARSSFRAKVPSWTRELLAEMVGTFLLVMIGDCGIACYHLNRDSLVGLDLFAVAFTFGVAAMIGIIASGPISGKEKMQWSKIKTILALGSHLNPAVTLAFATIGKLPFRKVPHYFAGQYLGGFLAAVVVFATYHEGIDFYDQGNLVPWYSPDLYNSTIKTLATGGIFSTYPAPWMTATGTLIDQIIATFTLVFAVMIITSPQTKVPEHLHPLMLGLTICAMVVAFGLNCGATLNPARDLSPRLFQLVVGYGVNAFKPLHCLYWLTAGLIGPHLGAIIGAWAFDFLLYYEEEVEEDLTSAELTDTSGDRKLDGTKKPFLASS